MEFVARHERNLQQFKEAQRHKPEGALARRRFRAVIRHYYRVHGRYHPWRETRDAYEILVSEFMLQQTQVARVLPSYRAFLEVFPNMQSLADAPLSAVLRQWQGLGYNRRGRALQQCVLLLLEQHQGQLPTTESELQCLPGVGPYTAAALRSFVHGLPSVMVETNIRTVVLHFFFSRRRVVHEEEIRSLVAATLDRRDPRAWYYALMDYGTYLKQQGIRNNKKMREYRGQSKFEGSRRQVRGAVLRYLVQHHLAKPTTLTKKLGIASERLEPALQDLIAEQLLIVERGVVSIKESNGRR